MKTTEMLDKKGFEAQSLVRNKSFSLQPDRLALSQSLKIINRFSFRSQTLPELLISQALSRPNELAAVSQEGGITFQELLSEAQHLGEVLSGLGVVADTCVGLFVEPSQDLLIAVWGILFSGGAYLPLSPEYPEERLKYMLQASQTNIVVTQRKLRARLMALVSSETTVVCMEDLQASLDLRGQVAKRGATPHSRRPWEKVAPHHLAYVIYTSGSTGKPKGVMIEHKSIFNQMLWLEEESYLSPASVILQKTPISFDAAQWEILAPACGARVVMATPQCYKNPPKLIQLIQKHQVNTLQCVPTLLQALLDSEDFRSCKTLRKIFCGGEALTRSLAKLCVQVMPLCELVNLYGPTECTINSSAAWVSRESLDASLVDQSPQSITIGKPITQMSYHILDSSFMPVQGSEMGELYIGGVGLARGYLHQAELTRERFLSLSISSNSHPQRLYRTGDLAYWNSDGSVQYAGRCDTQVKLRGYRVELDEIRCLIDDHPWIKRSAVIVKKNLLTGFDHLVSFIELHSKEAVLMDQGVAEAHHQSKGNKAQVKMQLQNPGCRPESDSLGRLIVELPGVQENETQRRKVFSRKSYRFFEGGNVSQYELARLFEEVFDTPNGGGIGKEDSLSGLSLGQSLSTLSFDQFGYFLRYLGQFHSSERLLPKYGYASPGALYATQIYFEVNGAFNLKDGFYYYHPVHHRLELIQEQEFVGVQSIKVHFIGKKSAIEPIYKNNILEVLEIEVGHILALMSHVLSEFNLDVYQSKSDFELKSKLVVSPDDYYLGSFSLGSKAKSHTPPPVEYLLQIHSLQVTGLSPGLYTYQDQAFKKVSNQIIQKRDVIAINQETYQRSSFGVVLLSGEGADSELDLSYIQLGYALQKLQMNANQLGLMSSGYSSKTGFDLPSEIRMQKISAEDELPLKWKSSYFAVGGKVSEAQWLSEGMKEDSVHMRGPVEIIRDDLVKMLPEYMIPNQIVVLKEFPLSENGKVDQRALSQIDIEWVNREVAPPRTELEKKILRLWETKLKRKDLSIRDSFFEVGGNSLIAVSLILAINRELNVDLGVQVLFECPTVEKLAEKILDSDRPSNSRMIQLSSDTEVPSTESASNCFAWPGLGGFCMNLKALAERASSSQKWFGVQAYGLNEGEQPYSSLSQMAVEDIKLIKSIQPEGPYRLLGYSFGARVALEVALQMEQNGDLIQELVLLAPGSPRVGSVQMLVNDEYSKEASLVCPEFLGILLSVFIGRIDSSLVSECLKRVIHEDSFIDYICELRSDLDRALVARVVRLVVQTYNLNINLESSHDVSLLRQLRAPVKIIKAQGDLPFILEDPNHQKYFNVSEISLDVDHYQVLKEPFLDEWVHQLKLSQ